MKPDNRDGLFAHINGGQYPDVARRLADGTADPRFDSPLLVRKREAVQALLRAEAEARDKDHRERVAAQEASEARSAVEYAADQLASVRAQIAKDEQSGDVLVDVLPNGEAAHEQIARKTDRSNAVIKDAAMRAHLAMVIERHKDDDQVTVRKRLS